MEPRDFGYRRRAVTFPRSKRRLIFDGSLRSGVDQSPAGQPPASNNCASVEDKERGPSANASILIPDEREKASSLMWPLTRCDQGKLPSGSSSKELALQVGPSQTNFKDRFVRLQMFLRRLDQDDQGEYKQMLRSLSAVDRSKHAVELEKRAIRLLLEEGAELQKLKRLNVLGEGSSKHN